MELPFWFGITALATFGWVLVNFLRYRALVLRGIKTRGLVVDSVQDADGEPQKLVVVFDDQQGITHRLVTHGGKTDWGCQVGKSVTVFYDPPCPERARVREDLLLQTWAGLALGIIFAVISIILLLR